MGERRFSVEYFNQQACEFIDLCGQKSFWEGPSLVRENAVKALGWVFLRTDGASQWTFEAALLNYSRRESLVLCTISVEESAPPQGEKP